MPKNTIKQAVAKIAESIGLAGKAKAARTAADLQEVIDDASAKLADAQRERTDLETRRATFLLEEGGDVMAYHGQVLAADQMVQTLQANIVTLHERRAEAIRNEATAALEARVAAVREGEAAELVKDWERFGEAVTAALRLAQSIDARTDAVAASDWDAQAAGRNDLVIDPERIRQEYVDGSQRPVVGQQDLVVAPPPVRPAKLERLPAESLENWQRRDDERWDGMMRAYQKGVDLRRQNDAAERAFKEKSSAEFLALGRELSAALERHVFHLEHYAAHRNRRVVQFQRYPNPHRTDGSYVEKQITVGGPPVGNGRDRAVAQRASENTASYDVALDARATPVGFSFGMSSRT